MSIKIKFAFVLLTFVLREAYALHPLGSEDPEPVAPDEIELELGAEHSDGRVGLLSLQVTTGLKDGHCLAIIVPADIDGSVVTLGGVSLWWKGALFSSGRGNLAMKILWELQSEDGVHNLDSRFIFSIRDNFFEYYINAIVFLEDAGNHTDSRQFSGGGSVALVFYRLSPALPVLEFHGLDLKDSYEAHLLLGLIWEASEGLLLDAGVAKEFPDGWNFLLGTTYTF